MKKIRNKLSVATCTLLSQSIPTVQAIENAWKVDTSLLYYAEVDRINVTKAVGEVNGDVSDTNTINLKVVLDTMSGSTPSGAVKGTTSSFTGASGGGSIGGGTSGALAKFDDTRAAVSLDWTHSYTRTLSVTYNGAFSIENDYRSFSTALTTDKETDNKAYKFTVGVAGTIDQLFRVGGNDTPAPLSLISDALSFGEGQKDTVDFIAGVTHVINRRTVGQVNLAVGTSKGYLTDPYKVFSVVGDTGAEVEQRYESRPGSRTRSSINLKLNHQLYPSNNIINASYRYYVDDWKVNSHTLDMTYHYKFENAHYLETRLRLYAQTKAFFYTNSFLNDPSSGISTTSILPNHISADSRLDDMTSGTLGIRYGRLIDAESHFRTRIEYIYQQFEASDFDTNKAFVLQFSYAKKF